MQLFKKETLIFESTTKLHYTIHKQITFFEIHRLHVGK